MKNYEKIFKMMLFNSLSPSAVLLRRIKPVPHTERRIETSQNIIVWHRVPYWSVCILPLSYAERRINT